MIQKQTWIFISDSTTVKWLQTFHLYKGFRRRVTYTGFFIKGSAKIVSPPQIEYKGFKFKFNSKGDICRSLIIRSKFNTKKNDGLVLWFPENNGILIKKKQNIKSKYLVGPVSRELKRRKVQLLFKTVI